MKTRPVILVIVTLVIGFFLGMLTSAQIRSHRLNPVRVFFSEEKFREGFYSAIQPTEEQKLKIDLILDKYAKINSDAHESFRKDFDARMEEFRNEIDSNLTEDQIARLKEMDAKRQKVIRSGRNRHDRNNYEHNRGDGHGPDMRPSGDNSTPPIIPPEPDAAKDSTGLTDTE